jgi:hypothetical protein
MRRFQDYVLDREGNAVAGAEVYVRKQSDSTLATIYSDNGVTTKANPTTTDNDGEWFYYAADDTYKFQVYVDGVQQNEVTHVQHYDLSVITTFGWSLLDDANAGAVRTTLGLGTSAVLDEATAAQLRANTADKVITTDVMWAAAAFVALTPGANVAVDMSAGFNFTLAMGGNYTLDNPTNAKAGQQGVIQITQDGTGSRTLAYGTAWKFAGGLDPSLSLAAGSIDLLYYEVLADGSAVYANLVKAIA